MATEGQGEFKKIPDFSMRVCEILSDFMNKNRKVRGGGPIEDKTIEPVLELFSCGPDWMLDIRDWSSEERS